MKKLFKFIVIFLAILFVFGVGFLSAIILSPQISEKVVPFVIQQSLENVKIQELTIEQQKIDLSGKIAFKNIHILLKLDEESFEINVDEIAVADIFGILIAKEKIEIKLTGGSIMSSALQANGVHVKLRGKGMESWSGSVEVAQAETNGFEVDSLTMDMQTDLKKVILSNMKGKSYGGIFTVRATIDLIPQIQYSTTVIFDDINTFKMREFNEEVFSQIQGNIFGTIEIEGNESSIEKMDVVAQFKDQGEIKSRLLAPLLSQIPKSTQRKTLDELIKNDANIQIDHGLLKLKNIDSNNISTNIALDSKEMNLDMNVAVDIVVDNGLQSLLEYFIQFSNTTKGL